MTAEPMYQPHPLLDHRGPWTEEDYLALPEIEGLRIELVDGELIMSPIGEHAHQRLVGRLFVELDRLLPEPFEALPGANVRLGFGRFNIPDVVVLTEPRDVVFSQAAEVPLAVEVVSKSGRARDRILKPALYAEAGIRWYLVVEHKPELLLILYRLANGAYVEHGRAREGERLELPDLGVTLETDALIRRR